MYFDPGNAFMGLKPKEIAQLKKRIASLMEIFLVTLYIIMGGGVKNFYSRNYSAPQC